MAKVLPDGTVVPSNLDVYSPSGNHYNGDYLGDYALHQGEVRAVIYPDDPKSRTKRLIEYSVAVQYFKNGTGTTRLYTNAVLMNGLMSLADVETFSLRKYASSGEQKSGQSPIKHGSKVLLLCLNGQSNFPVIVGGLYDPDDTSQKEVDKDKKFYLWRFNGIECAVNDDGELTYTYTGKRDDDGKTDVDDSVAGTYLKLDKDGNATLSDKDGKNALTIDHKNKKVKITRDSAFELGEATDKMLLGESFRNAQKSMDTKLQTNFNALKNLAQQAGTAATTAGAKMLVPTTGPVAAAPDVTQLGALLISMSQLLGQISQSIQDFENSAAQKNGYLSKKNSAD